MLLEKLIEKRAESVNLGHPRDPALARIFRFFGMETAAGVTVTADNAPETVAVMACVKVLSETMGSLPMVLYKKADNDGKEKAKQHPLYNILRYQPNNWQSWMEFSEMMTAHVALRGNAYAEIYYNRSGQITQLIPLHPDQVMPFLVNDSRAYRHQPVDGEERVLLRGEVFHVSGLSFNGINGLNPIEFLRHAVALAKASESYGSRFFSNDARPGFVLKHPAGMSDKAYNRLIANWEKRHRGESRSHKAAILEEGMDIHELGVSPEDAQFLETRKFQKDEIAGFFRVPPHMIGNLSEATFSNIENQSRSFIDNTMLPWFTRWEQAIRRDLLTTSDERKNLMVEVEPAALLRGDLKSRYEAYSIGRNWGFLSVNDIRRRENMNPIEDGDKYLQPLNMTDLGNTDSSTDDQVRGIIGPIVEAAAERSVNREIKGLRRLADNGASLVEIAAFYKDHADFMVRSHRISKAAAADWCRQRAAVIDERGARQACELWQVEGSSQLSEFILKELCFE